MKVYARPIILALAAVALAASLASLYVHYNMLRVPDYSSFCDVSETVSCEAVYQSEYGTVYGVPVAAGGAIWSGLVLLLAARGWARLAPNADLQPPVMCSCCRCSVSLPCSTSATRPSSCSRRLCLLCMTMYVALIGIFIVSSSATSISIASLPARLLRDLRAVFLHPVAAGLAILWMVGSVSLIAFFPREEVQAPSGRRRRPGAHRDAGCGSTGRVARLARQSSRAYRRWLPTGDGKVRADQVQRLPVSVVPR